MSTGGIAAERLKSFVMRIRNLRAEIKGIQTDVKEVFAEAKGTGFDTKIIRQIITYMDAKEENAAALAEQEALFGLYKEAMGLSEGAGTNPDIPLNPRPAKGNKKGQEPPTEAEADDDAQMDIEKHLGGQPETPAEPVAPSLTEAQAFDLGKGAGAAGEPITGNPFGAADPNRHAWELGWCEATGSDGMDLPHAPPPKSSKKTGKPPGKPSGKPAPTGENESGAGKPDGEQADKGGDWSNLDDNFSKKGG